MSFRFMRIILFFDLPSITSEEKRAYRHFVRDLTNLGFYRLQESVFCKMSVNMNSVTSTYKNIAKIKPKDGNVFALLVTEHQFATMRIFLGENSSDVITSFDRMIEL